MASFTYQAIDRQGKTLSGNCQAESLKQARQLLRDKQVMVIKITENSIHATGFKAWLARSKQTISVGDLSLVTRQLATLLRAGVSLEETLQSVGEESESPAIKQIILGLRTKILEGFGLARAMEEYPHVFSRLFYSTVAAGEKTGRLDEVLDRLADFVERRQQIRQKIIQAAVYPSIVTLTSISIVGFLLAYVVPKMVTVFIDSGQILPLPTRILLAVSGVAQSAGLYVLVLAVLGFFAFRSLLKKPAVRYWWDTFLLTLPLVGLTIRLVNTARFAHTFAMLNQAGVEVLESMRVGAETVDNVLISDSLKVANRQVREGVPIYRALQKTGYFPPLSLQLISSGESSGQLGPMLERAAFIQENAVKSRIDLLLSLFEPFIILFMGSVVLFIVLAILLPIFDLNQMVS
jgi:general secretion pathway protein F